MRHATSFTFAFLITAMGCSTYSATLVSSPDAGATGGTVNVGSTATSDTAAGGNTASGGDTSSPSGAGATGGAAATIGSSSATGGAPIIIGGSSALGSSTSTSGASSAGSSGLGGASTTGGASASNGGVTSAAGTSTIIGGASATGGAPSSGGASPTGGANSCTKDADCINPDPINCTFTCVNPGATGTCKPAATLTPTQCATTACDDRAISGFWDAAGNPHIAYGFTETDGSATIRMQQVKADGTTEGMVASYKLAANQLAPRLLSANATGSKVGLLYKTRVEGAQANYTEYDRFALTDVVASPATPSELSNNGNSGATISWFRLDVTSTGAWLALGFYTNPIVKYWEATTGSNLAPWTSLIDLFWPIDGAATVVGNTLFISGATCNKASGGSTCNPAFGLHRYSATNFSTVGSTVTLRPTAQQIAAAMGSIAGHAALLWSEDQEPGQLYRALINEDGSLAIPVGSVQLAISPRAIVPSGAGRSLLIGVITTGPNYQLVAQRVDSNLSLLGNPFPIAAAQSEDVTALEMHPSADGTQVLVTYRQSGARYRLIGSNLCGG